MPSSIGTDIATGRSGDPGRRRWAMAARRAVLVLVVLAALLCALYALLPWLVAGLAPRLASTLGVDALSVAVDRPGLTRWHVQALEVARAGVHVTASGSRIDYHLGGLLGGRLDAVHVREATVRIDTAAEPRERAGRGDPPEVEALFAAVPADRLGVETLHVRVPALGFRAVGGLEMSSQRLEARLEGLAPAEAESLALTLMAQADGTVRLGVSERGAAGPPFVDLTSDIRGGRLEIDGELALQGFPLDLTAVLAGLPPGDGRVGGAFSVEVPWPLPEFWRLETMAGRGSLSIDWRATGAPWRLSGLAAQWQLQAGELSGTVAGAVGHEGRELRLQASAERLSPAGPTGAGMVSVFEGTEQPALARVAWVLNPDQLMLEGTFRLHGTLLAAAAEQAGLPPGQGDFDGEVSARLPWPLPADWETLQPRAQGTLSGGWRWPEAGAGVRRLDGVWRFEQQTLSGSLDGLVAYQGLESAAGVQLDALAFDQGVLTGRGTAGIGEVARLPFSVRHDPDGGSGNLALQGEVVVDEPLAEQVLDGWNEPYDVTAGEVTLTADVDWSRAGIGGSVQAGLRGLDAHYQDYVVSGVDGRLAFSAARGGAWSLEPAALELATVDTGVVLRDVNTGVAWAADLVSVQATSADLLGGTARVAPFAYRLSTGMADFVVDVADLELSQILALEGEHVSGTGTIDGTLPVRVRDNVASIVAGQVRSDPPGGVLRVSQTLAGGTGQPGLDFALRALQDFRYDVLAADVAYSGSGDLTLAVRLEGSNPEIEGGRPIHYNVTVNENLPTLLKSLRLQDELTRRIEREVTD